MTTTSRRPRRALAAGVLLMVGPVAACGTDTSPDDGDSASGASDAAAGDSALPEAEGTTEYPLTIDTWLGESTLEERPERVAVVGYSSTLDSVEALDVVPVYYGGRDAEQDYEYNEPEFLDAIETKDVNEDFTPNAEAIAASRPDLIITNGILVDESVFDRLSSIAPVLDVPEDPGNGDQADWRAEQLAVGEALDLADAAQQAVDDADGRIADVAAAHPEFEGRTATIAFDYGPEYGLEYYTVTGGPAEGLMLDLGFAPNPLAEEFVASPTVSDENQNKLDADALVMIYNTDAERETRESKELFAALPAVEDDRYESLVYPEDPEVPTLTRSDGDDVQNAVWVLRRGASAIALPWAAEVVADQWLADVPLS